MPSHRFWGLEQWADPPLRLLVPVFMYETGAQVVTEGLKNAKLNNKAATVVRWDAVDCRYELQIEGIEDTRMIKPENVLLAPSSTDSSAVEGCRDYILGDNEEMEEVDYEADWRCSGRPCAKVYSPLMQHARTDSGEQVDYGFELTQDEEGEQQVRVNPHSPRS